MVEDSDEDYAVFFRIMQDLNYLNPLYRVGDGDEALNYLYQRGEYAPPRPAPRPALILMDLNLPGTDGREVIKQIRRDEGLNCIPIVVLTTSSSPRDIKACYRCGANSYMLKPIGIEVLEQTIRDFFQYWFRSVALPQNES